MSEKYQSREYPKALTVKIRDARGVTRFVPVIYPDGHPRAGEFVVFHSAKEEDKYDGVGVPAHHRPEQVSPPGPSYLYDPWDPWVKN